MHPCHMLVWTPLSMPQPCPTCTTCWSNSPLILYFALFEKVAYDSHCKTGLSIIKEEYLKYYQAYINVNLHQI